MKKTLKLFGWLIVPAILVSQLFIPWLSPEWWRLQRLGRVDGDISKMYWWRPASQTTWWGKPLDPSEFWKDRPIWNDDSATAEAHRRGRGYPPIPTHRPDLIEAPSNSYRSPDIVPNPLSGGPDSGPIIPFYFTEVESIYWTWFRTKHPIPPTVLEREQFRVADHIFRMRMPLIVDGRDISAIPAERLARSEQADKGQAREMGVPQEALSEDALLWAYVVHKRKEYEDLQTLPSQRDYHLKILLERLPVNPGFITNSLTAEQLQAIKAWKTDYLRRLRRENADELYIQAYLKAWGLTTNELAVKAN